MMTRGVYGTKQQQNQRPLVPFRQSRPLVRLPPWSEEFLRALFSMLGGFTLTSCACVSKRWNKMIENDVQLWHRLVVRAKIQGNLCFSSGVTMLLGSELSARQLYQKYFALHTLTVDALHADTLQSMAEYCLLANFRINDIPLVSIVDEHEPQYQWDCLAFDSDFFKEIKRHIHFVEKGNSATCSLKVLCLWTDDSRSIAMHVEVAVREWTVRWSRSSDKHDEDEPTTMVWHFNRGAYLNTLKGLLGQKKALVNNLALTNRGLEFNTSKYF